MPWFGQMYGGGYDPNDKSYLNSKKLSLDQNNQVTNWSQPGSTAYNMGINKPTGSNTPQINPNQQANTIPGFNTQSIIAWLMQQLQSSKPTTQTTNTNGFAQPWTVNPFLKGGA